MNQNCYLELLSYDLVEFLLGYLNNVKDVISLSKTNKNYYGLISNNHSFWCSWLSINYPELKHPFRELCLITNDQSKSIEIYQKILTKVKLGELVTRDSYLNFGAERLFLVAGRQVGMQVAKHGVNPFSLFNHFISKLGFKKEYGYHFIIGVLEEKLVDDLVINLLNCELGPGEGGGAGGGDFNQFLVMCKISFNCEILPENFFSQGDMNKVYLKYLSFFRILPRFKGINLYKPDFINRIVINDDIIINYPAEIFYNLIAGQHYEIAESLLKTFGKPLIKHNLLPNIDILLKIYRKRSDVNLAIDLIRKSGFTDNIIFHHLFLSALRCGDNLLIREFITKDEFIKGILYHPTILGKLLDEHSTRLLLQENVENFLEIETVKNIYERILYEFMFRISLCAELKFKFKLKPDNEIGWNLFNCVKEQFLLSFKVKMADMMDSLLILKEQIKPDYSKVDFILELGIKFLLE